ncbi:hypothetical protein ACPV5U_08475 [Vibrio mediterranei]
MNNNIEQQLAVVARLMELPGPLSDDVRAWIVSVIAEAKTQLRE